MPTLWCQAWSALGILRVGGTFICKVTDSFGRCAVGTYFLICHCFREVTIIKPSMSNPSKSERFLVALDFLGHTHDTVRQVREHFASALRHSASSSENDDVREILPTPMLLQQPFLDGIIKLNERCQACLSGVFSLRLECMLGSSVGDILRLMQHFVVTI